MYKGEDYLDEVKEEAEADPIAEAKQAAIDLKEANAEKAKLLEREEALNTLKMLGGKSDAGAKPKEKTEEEKEVDSARAMLAGTGYEDILFPKDE
jgi:hypothetical protein